MIFVSLLTMILVSVEVCSIAYDVSKDFNLEFLRYTQCYILYSILNFFSTNTVLIPTSNDNCVYKCIN